MGKIVLHPTHAERLWLITAHRDSGVLYEDAPPLLILQCRRAGWVESASDPGAWRPTAGSLAEALLPAGGGANRRLERITGLIDWAPMERLLAPLRPPTGRPGYPPLALFRALLAQ